MSNAITNIEDKLTKEEIITILLRKYPDCIFTNYDYYELEKLFIITIWLKENTQEDILEYHQYSIMRLKYIFFDLKCNEKRWCFYNFSIIAFTILNYILISIGFYVFMHEVFGHLYFSGNLLTEPKNRYNIVYPNRYYQVDKFDNYINMDKIPINYIKFAFNLYNPSNYSYLDDNMAGLARPYLLKTNFSDIYYLWGPDQSNALMYLSGFFPNYLLSIVLGIIGLYDNLYNNCYIKLEWILLSIQIYALIIVNICRYMYFDTRNNSKMDILKWSNYMYNYTKSHSPESYQNQIILILLILYPLIIISLYVYFRLKNNEFLHKRILYNYIIRHHQYEQLLYEKMLLIPQKKWKSWYQKLKKNISNNTVFSQLYETIYLNIKNEDYLHIYERPFILGYNDIWNKIYEAIKVVLFISILVIPVLNCFYYSFNADNDTVKFLPLIYAIIIDCEFVYSRYCLKIDFKKNQHLILRYIEIGVLILLLYISVEYYKNYDISNINFLWGDTYIIIYLVLLSLSNFIEYKKYSDYFLEIYDNTLSDAN